MKRSKKRKKGKSQQPPSYMQTEIAEETEVQCLRRQVARLRQLPNDFRDVPPGTQAWTDYGELMGPVKQKEMEKWLRGPTLILAPLSRGEQIHYRDAEIIESCSAPTDFSSLTLVLAEAQHLGCSFVYLPEFKREIAECINILLSRFGSSIRVRGLLTDENGRPLGVVY